MMMRTAVTIVLVACVALTAGARGQTGLPPAASGDQDFPAFLPPYFRSVLDLTREHLHLAQQSETNGVTHYLYISEDQADTVGVDNIPCDNTKCDVVFRNARGYVDQQATPAHGWFRAASATEFQAGWRTGLAENATFVYQLPDSILLWSYTTRLEWRTSPDARFKAIGELVARERYSGALARGNVDVGKWDPQILDYAHQLLKVGFKTEARDVLRNLLATTPFDYEAQLDFALLNDDPAAVRDSARAVFDNAEDPTLITRAADFLGQAQPAPPPILSDRETGLQLILIALPPCDLRLLRDAAAIYEKVTGVPVKTARLPAAWEWGTPDRVPEQKLMQTTILELSGPGVDFTGWSLDRYVTALTSASESRDPLTKFYIQDFIRKLAAKHGQYLVDNYVPRLLDLLAPHRSRDNRTMYVGVTEANIYSGDNNYLFSLYTTKNGAGASILSYAMMTAAAANEHYQSRNRLTERLAKEMVPASLKILGIARPVDPTDPYSYSDGVERLSQKTLTLSGPTREALDKFR
jgi:hypothetical protein